MRQEEIEKVIAAIPDPFYYGTRRTSFVLTGTFLLSIFNLIDKYGDVDVLVVDSDKDFWSDFISENEHKIIGGFEGYDSVKIESNGYIFNFIKDDGYSINSDSTNILLQDVVYLDSLQHALQAKHNLRRDKDKAHFVEINEKLNSLIQE